MHCMSVLPLMACEVWYSRQKPASCPAYGSAKSSFRTNTNLFRFAPNWSTVESPLLQHYTGVKNCSGWTKSYSSLIWPRKLKQISHQIRGLGDGPCNGEVSGIFVHWAILALIFSLAEIANTRLKQNFNEIKFRNRGAPCSPSPSITFLVGSHFPWDEL